MLSYLLLPAAYLLGSIPVSLIIGLVFYKVDIRRFGSGNIGASNFYRTIRDLQPTQAKPVGAFSFALDVLKGFLPVFLARQWYSGAHWLQVTSGLCAIMGHNNSIFLKFKGGKGVATSCGVAFALSWQAAAAGLTIFLVITYITGFISLGSVVSAPIAAYLLWKLNHQSLPYGLFALLVAFSVLIKHRTNISRLLAGTELSIWDKKLKTVEEVREEAKVSAE